jgi:hypothetical protein
MTHINPVHVFVWIHRYLTADWQTLRGLEDEKEGVFREFRLVTCFLSAPQERYDVMCVFISYPFIELKILSLYRRLHL